MCKTINFEYLLKEDTLKFINGKRYLFIIAIVLLADERVLNISEKRIPDYITINLNI